MKKKQLGLAKHLNIPVVVHAGLQSNLLWEIDMVLKKLSTQVKL